MFILAGIVGAALSYLLNKLVLARWGKKGIMLVVPLVEEVSKTLGAYSLGASLLATHFIFGIIEGGYDLATSSKSIGKLAALASIFSHSLFGMGTWWAYGYSASLPASILVGWLLHSAWNWYVTKHL